MAKQATAAKAPSFGALLDKAPSEVEKPKPLPQGSYITILQGLPRQDKSARKQTEFVEFTHKLISANDDVDADELKEMGGIADKTIKNTYYITEGSLWRLKDFLGHCGLDLDDYETLREAIEDTPGKQVGIFINHEASQDGTSVFARIGKTFVVE